MDRRHEILDGAKQLRKRDKKKKKMKDKALESNDVNHGNQEATSSIKSIPLAKEAVMNISPTAGTEMAHSELSFPLEESKRRKKSRESAVESTDMNSDRHADASSVETTALLTDAVIDINPKNGSEMVHLGLELSCQPDKRKQKRKRQVKTMENNGTTNDMNCGCQEDTSSVKTTPLVTDTLVDISPKLESQMPHLVSKLSCPLEETKRKKRRKRCDVLKNNDRENGSKEDNYSEKNDKCHVTREDNSSRKNVLTAESQMQVCMSLESPPAEPKTDASAGKKEVKGCNHLHNASQSNETNHDLQMTNGETAEKIDGKSLSGVEGLGLLSVKESFLVSGRQSGSPRHAHAKQEDVGAEADHNCPESQNVKTKLRKHKRAKTNCRESGKSSESSENDLKAVEEQGKNVEKDAETAEKIDDKSVSGVEGVELLSVKESFLISGRQSGSSRHAHTKQEDFGADHNCPESQNVKTKLRKQKKAKTNCRDSGKSSESSENGLKAIEEQGKSVEKDAKAAEKRDDKSVSGVEGLELLSVKESFLISGRQSGSPRHAHTKQEDVGAEADHNCPESQNVKTKLRKQKRAKTNCRESGKSSESLENGLTAIEEQGKNVEKGAETAEKIDDKSVSGVEGVELLSVKESFLISGRQGGSPRHVHTKQEDFGAEADHNCPESQNVKTKLRKQKRAKTDCRESGKSSESSENGLKAIKEQGNSVEKDAKTAEKIDDKSVSGVEGLELLSVKESFLISGRQSGSPRHAHTKQEDVGAEADHNCPESQNVETKLRKQKRAKTNCRESGKSAESSENGLKAIEEHSKNVEKDDKSVSVVEGSESICVKGSSLVTETQSVSSRIAKSSLMKQHAKSSLMKQQDVDAEADHSLPELQNVKTNQKKKKRAKTSCSERGKSFYSMENGEKSVEWGYVEWGNNTEKDIDESVSVVEGLGLIAKKEKSLVTERQSGPPRHSHAGLTQPRDVDAPETQNVKQKKKKRAKASCRESGKSFDSSENGEQGKYAEKEEGKTVSVVESLGSISIKENFLVLEMQSGSPSHANAALAEQQNVDSEFDPILLGTQSVKKKKKKRATTNYRESEKYSGSLENSVKAVEEQGKNAEKEDKSDSVVEGSELNSIKENSLIKRQSGSPRLGNTEQEYVGAKVNHLFPESQNVKSKQKKKKIAKPNFVERAKYFGSTDNDENTVEEQGKNAEKEDNESVSVVGGLQLISMEESSLLAERKSDSPRYAHANLRKQQDVEAEFNHIYPEKQDGKNNQRKKKGAKTNCRESGKSLVNGFKVHNVQDVIQTSSYHSYGDHAAGLSESWTDKIIEGGDALGTQVSECILMDKTSINDLHCQEEPATQERNKIIKMMNHGEANTGNCIMKEVAVDFPEGQVELKNNDNPEEMLIPVQDAIQQLDNSSDKYPLNCQIKSCDLGGSDISCNHMQQKNARETKMEEVIPSSSLVVRKDLTTPLDTVKESNDPQILQPLSNRACVGHSKKKLLVLDLNGLLVDVVAGVARGYKPDFRVSGKAVFKRPFCDDFLKFCFERFDVGIWSSRLRKNVNKLVSVLLGYSRRNLLFCWDMSRCTKTRFKTIENKSKPLVLKELKPLWKYLGRAYSLGEGPYNETNTLLLDDSPYKALRNPAYTAVFPYSYNYEDTQDCSLGPGGDLRLYLERLALAEDVQKFVEQNPFGQPAISKTDTSWNFYSKIIGADSSKTQADAGTC